MGIGRAVVVAFAREGAKVAVADIDEQAGNDVVAAIRESGAEAFFQKTDVGVSEGNGPVYPGNRSSLRSTRRHRQQRRHRRRR